MQSIKNKRRRKLDQKRERKKKWSKWIYEYQVHPCEKAHKLSNISKNWLSLLENRKG
jgi:hypothetical protein